MEIKTFKALSIFIKKKKADGMFKKCKKMRKKMNKTQKNCEYSGFFPENLV